MANITNDHSSLPRAAQMRLQSPTAHVMTKTLAMDGVGTGHQMGLFCSPRQDPLRNHSQLPQILDSSYSGHFFLVHYLTSQVNYFYMLTLCASLGSNI